MDSYKFHHSALARGYVRVGHEVKEPYNGKFGRGYKLYKNNPQGRRITRRRCKPGHPLQGGRSWVTSTITSPAQIYNAHPSPTMAASPPGCWHKSNGSRYTSPQNRLHPPPHERGQENNIQEAKAG